MTRVRLLVAALLVALAVSSTGLSSGAFTATSKNPSTFTASSSFPSLCSAGTASVTADIDTSIRSTGTAPGGNDGFLTVGTTTAGGNSLFRSMVRFQLPAIPAGCAFNAATLRLTASSASTPRTLNVHLATGSWSEATTWPGPAFGATALAQASAATGQISWTVTSAVQAIYGGATNNGFLIKDSAESFAQNGNRTQVFASSEAPTAAQRPTLVVSYQ